MSFSPVVGRQESMRWAAPATTYDGGDWEDNELAEVDEEEETVPDHHSIKSEDLNVNENDYRDIYEYYNEEEQTHPYAVFARDSEQDDEDRDLIIKRQSYQQQLEDDIMTSLTPGHSRETSMDSQPDPELAALYQGTSAFLSRPISTLIDSTRPLSLNIAESDQNIREILTPKLSTDNPTFDEDNTPIATPTTAHSIKSVDPEEPSEQPPPAPSTMGSTPSQSQVTPPHSPSMAHMAVTPSDFPELREESSPPVAAADGEPATPVAPAPALALTCATPEGSDTEKEDKREHPDWQPRWAPEVKKSDGPEKSLGTDLHESQVSLDLTESDTATQHTGSTSRISGYVDEKVNDDTDGAETDNEEDGDQLDLPSLDSKTSREDQSPRSTIASDSAMDERSEFSSTEPNEQPALQEPSPPAPISKGLVGKISRAPTVNLEAVFALKTTAERQKALWELRVKETEYSTQLSTWLETTYSQLQDKSPIFSSGIPPQTEGRALPVSRQVGTTLSHSGTKTKETFIKVGDRGKKGLNAMKKLMRHTNSN